MTDVNLARNVLLDQLVAEAETARKWAYKYILVSNLKHFHLYFFSSFQKCIESFHLKQLISHFLHIVVAKIFHSRPFFLSRYFYTLTLMN